MLVEGNHIHDIEGMGIHIHGDGSVTGMIIRNNHFHVCGGNCIGFYPAGGGSNIQVYNNLIHTNRSGSAFPDSGNLIDVAGISNSFFYNNTLVGGLSLE
jgi:hypothetical protein